jgi:hypothetical protein
MSVYVQTNQPIVLTLTPAAVAIAAADTGKLFLVGPMAQATIITLPALAAGLHYRFQTTVAGAALAFLCTIRAVAATNINGVLANVADGLGVVTARTSLAFVSAATPCGIGDTIDLYCDGTQWSVFAFARLTGGIALA